MADDLEDADFDGITNGLEATGHTDPTRNDVIDFSAMAYRYSVAVRRDDTTLPGRLCYDFDISNITLVPTGTATGQAPGTNDLLLRVVSAPADAPDDFGSHLVACVRPTYRASPEAKTPPSGHVAVSRDAFKAPASSIPDDPEVFNATRDCIVP